MRRGAVIDVGSNTVHLLVADSDGARLLPVCDESVPSVLAKVAAGQAVNGAKRGAALAAAVQNFVTIAGRYGAEEIVLVGTQSVRTAPDRDDLKAAIKRATGLRLDVVTPEREALLCLAGAVLGSLPPRPFLLADIGGGSTDLAVSGLEGVEALASVPTGSGVLSVQWLEGDPPPSFQAQRAAAQVRRLLDEHAAHIAGSTEELVATGGAARRVLQQAGFLSRLEGGRDTLALDALVEGVLSEPAARWPRRPKDQRRAAVARGGAVILREIVTHWQISRWRVSSYGLREGVLNTRFGCKALP